METLTVQYLARELDARWRGRRVSSFAMHGTEPAVVLGAAGAATVRFDLSRQECRVSPVKPARECGPLEGFEIAGVDAPIDDRTIIVSLVKPGKFRGSLARNSELVISLVPNARGAVLTNERGHRLASVGSKPHDPKEPRPVLGDDELRLAARANDQQALMRGRWVGPAVARWLLEEGEQIVQRYAELVALPPAKPTRCGGAILPLPLCVDPEPLDSLIEPERASDTEPPSAPDAPERDPNVRAIARMRAELERAAQAPLVRAAAELLLAMPADTPVPPGLTMPDGARFDVQAKAGDTPHAVAQRLFTKARSMDRARLTLPDRIAKLESRGSEARSRPAVWRDRSAPHARMPYKRFMSRGGLEIRVGRSARDNDDLTFHHSSPDDVWMHARDAAGSHVVLRWTDEGAPPASDLEEAAILAAWHSQSRGSTVVPVDWTRRRYVRKPRGAGPGSVLVSRAKTVMARPTSEAVRAIRDRS